MWLLALLSGVLGCGITIVCGLTLRDGEYECACVENLIHPEIVFISSSPPPGLMPATLWVSSEGYLMLAAIRTWVTKVYLLHRKEMKESV